MGAVEVYDCERRARTVAAIKYLRELRGLRLAEAKHLIDEVYYGRRSVTLAFGSEDDAGAFADCMGSLGFRCRFAAPGETPDAEPGAAADAAPKAGPRC